jgi:hypothetical protein
MVTDKIKKQVISFIVYLIPLVILLLYIIFQKTQSGLEIQSLTNKEKMLVDYLSAKSEIEGMFIWDTGILSQGLFEELIQKPEVKMPALFFLYDSVGCSICYNFHVNKINGTKKLSNAIIMYNNRFKFLKNDFPNKYFIDCIKYNFKYKELLLFVNSKGKILYVDFPQYGRPDLSENFYKTILKF